MGHRSGTLEVVHNLLELLSVLPPSGQVWTGLPMHTPMLLLAALGAILDDLASSTIIEVLATGIQLARVKRHFISIKTFFSASTPGTT